MKTWLATYIILFSFACHAQKTIPVNGTVSGFADIGPMCPVEPCNLSTKQLADYYANFVIVIYDKENKEFKKISIDSSGTFTALLPSGTYTVHIKPLEGDGGNLEQLIVSKGSMTKIKLSYDTGLR